MSRNRKQDNPIQGHPLTNQRCLLLELLRDAEGHIDAKELYRHASTRDESISPATVYRSLNLFKELGLIPEFLIRIINFLKAPMVGDVQISPVIYCSDIQYLLSTPDPRFVQYCIQKGQLATWRMANWPPGGQESPRWPMSNHSRCAILGPAGYLNTLRALSGLCGG